MKKFMLSVAVYSAAAIAVLAIAAGKAFAASSVNAEMTFQYTLSPIDPNGAGPAVWWPTVDEQVGVAYGTVSVNYTAVNDSNGLGLNAFGSGNGDPAYAYSDTQLIGSARNGDTTFRLLSTGTASGYRFSEEEVGYVEEHATSFSSGLGGGSDFTIGANTIMTWNVNYSIVNQHDGLGRTVGGVVTEPAYFEETAGSQFGLILSTLDGQGQAFWTTSDLGDNEAGSFSVTLRNDTAADLFARIEFVADSFGVGLLPPTGAGFPDREQAGGLAPVPEPGTYALMLLGLSAVAFGARRRRV